MSANAKNTFITDRFLEKKFVNENKIKQIFKNSTGKQMKDPMDEDRKRKKLRHTHSLQQQQQQNILIKNS